MLLPLETCWKTTASLRWLALLVVVVLHASPAFSAPLEGEKLPAEEGAEAPEEPPRHAFKLGDFRIKNFRPVEREKVTMQFTVYIEVQGGQEERFESVWDNHEHRIRNQVITSARLVPPNEFDDPTLHALRRRIYLRLRRAVPELPVSAVFISDFSYLLE